jgi:zinc transport system substrate-binding protein
MFRYFIFLFTLFFSFSVFAADNKVIASIKPLHSLVAAVMEGSNAQPMLLVDGKASPHTYSLKPSQVGALQKADIVFIIGDNFELFLQKTLSTLPKHVTRVALDKEAQLIFYPIRQNKDFEPHEDGHDEKQDGSRDLHYWLLTDNAKVMVMEIARQLAIVYPSKREIYFANARRINDRLEQAHIDLDQRMLKLNNKHFIVFHDAFQYFENDYRLKASGSITLHAGEMPGAKHISELRKKIKTLGAVCVFREPSFDGKVVDGLLAGTGAKGGVLDPEGVLLAPGPELYFQLLEGIAKGLEDCLR